MTKRLLVLLLLGACGSSSDPTADNFAERFTSAYCQHAIACGQMPDEATCRVAASVMFGNYYTALEDDGHAGIVQFDPSKAAACIDDLGKLSCDYDGPREQSTANADCGATFVGTLAAGASCANGGECASQICAIEVQGCDLSTTCCPGSCEAARPAPAAEGGDCSESFECASADDVCLTSATGSTCQPRPTVGLPCPSGYCGEGLLCTFDVSATTEVCLAPVPIGASCAGRLCSQSTCDPVTMTCTPYHHVGEACDEFGGGCGPGTRCDPSTSLCTEQLPPGSSCHPSSDDCLVGDCDTTTLTCPSPPVCTAS